MGARRGRGSRRPGQDSSDRQTRRRRVRRSSGLDRFGFDEPSIQWLDGFIERQRVRDDVGPDFVNKMISVLGSYLGECIIRCYGGKWSVGEAGWHVEFDAKNAAFPFAKVAKQFANGAEDGIYSFFTLIPIVFPAVSRSGSRGEPTPTRNEGAAKPSWFQRLFRRGSGR